MFYGWRPYVPVAVRRRRAMKEMERLRRGGKKVSPVVIEGRAIARTFWGSSWCENLERYSDYANRLPRGRTYVRNGSVMDLQIRRGAVEALVSGSEIYEVGVKIAPILATRWKAVRQDCVGSIESLVELLQGNFSKGVMERMCRQGTGLFPSPGEIKITCSCPDWAGLCKHAAAALYGVGARLDDHPDLLFVLRGVDGEDLVTGAAEGLSLAEGRPAAGRTLNGADLSAVFGIEMEATPPPAPKSPPAARGKAKKATGPRRPARNAKTPVPRKGPKGR
jgi:uncharacterized Zn finger protein